MRTVYCGIKGDSSFGNPRAKAEQHVAEYAKYGVIATISEDDNHIFVHISKTSPLLCTLERQHAK